MEQTHLFFLKAFFLVWGATVFILIAGLHLGLKRPTEMAVKITGLIKLVGKKSFPAVLICFAGVIFLKTSFLIVIATVLFVITSTPVMIGWVVWREPQKSVSGPK